MNYLKNGNIAVGAPGSKARVKEEYPEIISKLLDYWYVDGFTYADAIEFLTRNNITDEMTINAIISHTPFDFNF